MTDFEKLLRAGIVWRNARNAVFGQMGGYKKMDQYSEACDALEKTVSELAPVADKIVRPVPLEEALEASVKAGLGSKSHATYTDDHCPICLGGKCKSPVYSDTRKNTERFLAKKAGRHG
jgi:hypothetical protein